MKYDEPNNPNVDEDSLFPILEQYMDLPSGQLPSRQEIEAQYPELADELWRCIEGMALIRGDSDGGNWSEGGGSFPASAFLPTREDLESLEPKQQEEDQDDLPTENYPNMEPIGDFQIFREIGRGGMGVVYEARQCSLGRKVALKVLPLASTYDPRQLQRFQNEAAAAAQLEHPSIVPIYAIGNERGIHYYAMRFIDGPHLGTLIRDLRTETSGEKKESQNTEMVPTRTLSEASTRTQQLYSHHRHDFYRRVAELMKQAAEALDYAHQCGIVHRDIKPGNLLVDSKGKLWITDFGLAHIQSNVQLTQTGEVFGTPRYMSPEQAAGKVRLADHRVDIYSLGATFYEFLTLRPMFDEPNQVQLLRQIVQDRPPAPHTIDPQIPHDLETILLKATEKSPSDRYETAKDVAQDLERFLNNRPIFAKRPGSVERTLKWLRRHPSILVGTVLLMVAAFVVLAVNRHMISVEKQKTTLALGEAQARFQKAREAADTLIDLVENELGDDTSLAVRKTRQKLLDTALVLYQDFLTMDELDAETQSQLTANRNYIQRFMRIISDMDGMQPMFLLMDRAVQLELKITEEQRRKIQQHFEEMNRRGADSFREMRHLVPEERLEKMADWIRKNDAILTEVLTPQQNLRLTQIGWQIRPESLCEESMVEKLQLTDAQVVQIQEKLAIRLPDAEVPPLRDKPLRDGDHDAPLRDGDRKRKGTRGTRPEARSDEKFPPRDMGSRPEGDMPPLPDTEPEKLEKSDSSLADEARSDSSRRDRKNLRNNPRMERRPEKEGNRSTEKRSESRRSQDRRPEESRMKEVLLILTEEQRATWKVMTGEPFSFFPKDNRKPSRPDSGRKAPDAG